MGWFFLGLFIGSTFGIVTVCLMVAAKSRES